MAFDEGANLLVLRAPRHSLANDQGKAQAVWSNPPAVTEIVLVTDASDEQVDNRDIAELGELWPSWNLAVTEYQFPAELELGHDVVDVLKSDKNAPLVYPVLLLLLAGEDAGS